MSKHTPRPWAEDGTKNLQTYVVGGVDGLTHVCTVHDTETEQGRADLAIIAAAPDMLEALELALEDIKEAGWHKATYEHIEEAIRKANGESQCHETS